MADFVNQFIFSFELSWLDIKFIFSEHIHARKYEDIANNSFKDNETFYFLLISNAYSSPWHKEGMGHWQEVVNDEVSISMRSSVRRLSPRNLITLKAKARFFFFLNSQSYKMG